MAPSANRKLREQAWRDNTVVAKHTTFIYNSDDDGQPTPLVRNIELQGPIATRTSENMGPSKRFLKREAKKREAKRLAHKQSIEAGKEVKPVSCPSKSLSSLEKLPSEVLLCIIDYFQPKTMACLALASRTLLARLGNRTLKKLDGASRMMVMIALQRDHAELVLCTECQKLHSPWLSLGSETSQQLNYPCQYHRPPYDYTMFHQRLHPNVVKAWWTTKSVDTTALMKQLCQTQTVAHNQLKETFYIQQSEQPLTTPKFLLAKTQTVIVPASGDWNSRTVIGELLALINTMEDNICPHRTWARALRSSIHRRLEQERRLRWSRDGRTLLCLLAHDQACLCHRPPAQFSHPVGCSACPTDFATAVATFPGLAARALVMTTWKMIAEGPHCPPEYEWKESTLQPDLTNVADQTSRAFRMFEGDRFVGHNGSYRPRMKPLDIGRLLDFGHRLEFEGPTCGLPHRTGPDNRILHPDPEEEDVVSTLGNTNELAVAASPGPAPAQLNEVNGARLEG